MPKMLSADEAARQLGIGRDSVIRLIKRELLAGQMVGHTWVIEQDDLNLYKHSSLATLRPRKRQKRKAI